jgi:hypothetical protein
MESLVFELARATRYFAERKSEVFSDFALGGAPCKLFDERPPFGDFICFCNSE